jgi:cation transport ATPase
MAQESPDSRKKQYSQMRSILDYGMGGIILLFGFFFLFSEKLGFNFDLEPIFKYFFAFLCIIYGGWRIYRGYQKNYYSE